MNFTSSLALFGAMAVLALIPGPGIFAVVARTMASGLRHGFLVVAGVVAGDFVFITLALLGLVALAELMGGLFVVLKYLGAAYLVWLGLSLLFSKGSRAQVSPMKAPSRAASFAAGLLTTLGNPKAILFYLSFFPAFMDLRQVTVQDAVIVYAIATVAIGGVMFGYAFAAHQARRSIGTAGGGRFLRAGSGVLLLGSGVFVATRA
ncbi:MAG: LysE family translocator [Pseudomonadota bacterium]